MFIKTELMKKVKETIFKLNLQNELNPFLNVKIKDSIQDEIKDNIKTLTCKSSEDLNISEKDKHELYDLMMDLRSCGSKSYKFITELGQKLYTQKTESNLRVKQKFANASKVTQEVGRLLKIQSSQAVLVGGCVRDAIFGKVPKDYDFATDTHYDDVEELFTVNGFKIKEAGKQFLVMIVSKDEEDFEIAMFRKDGNYTDGRRPDSVEIGTIFDDAERRDFTINALSYNLTTEEVQDPNGSGLEDVKNKVLKFVGKPEERIQEDFLRIARFYRFLGRFKDIGMTPDNKSLKACRTNFAKMQEKVAPERLKNEIEKMVDI
jgi:hypothetical protein